VCAPVDAGLPAWSLRLISELASADLRTEAVANGLSLEQLNWRLWPGAWSIGQCIEHLRIANDVYLPSISAALQGREQARVQEIRLSRFSRWFIRNYIAPNPEGARAMAPKKIEPGIQVDLRVVETFLRSNQAAQQLIRRASLCDVNRVRFKNPFIPLLRFTVGTGLEIIAKHQVRHLLQAERVRESKGFPS
jgi:DinB superfamily